MDSKEKRLASFPEDVRAAHKHSSNHRTELSHSARCGCFHCGAIFGFDRITKWIGETTALCPSCRVDSVIGDASGFEISPAFLARMKSYWF